MNKSRVAAGVLCLVAAALLFSYTMRSQSVSPPKFTLPTLPTGADQGASAKEVAALRASVQEGMKERVKLEAQLALLQQKVHALHTSVDEGARAKADVEAKLAALHAADALAVSRDAGPNSGSRSADKSGTATVETELCHCSAALATCCVTITLNWVSTWRVRVKLLERRGQPTNARPSCMTNGCRVKGNASAEGDAPVMERNVASGSVRCLSVTRRASQEQHLVLLWIVWFHTSLMLSCPVPNKVSPLISERSVQQTAGLPQGVSCTA